MTRETPFDCFLLGPARAWSSPGGMLVWPLPCFLVNQTHQSESEAVPECSDSVVGGGEGWCWTRTAFGSSTGVGEGFRWGGGFSVWSATPSPPPPRPPTPPPPPPPPPRPPRPPRPPPPRRPPPPLLPPVRGDGIAALVFARFDGGPCVCFL